MAEETQLKGVIKLRADTSQVKKDVADIGGAGGSGSGAGAGAGGGSGAGFGNALSSGIMSRLKSIMGQAGGMVGSAAGSMLPATGVAVGIGAAVVGVLAFAKAIKSATENTLAYARQLSEMSGGMAVAMALYDVKKMMIDRQIGDALAPNMRELNDALIKLKESSKDIIIGWERMKIWVEKNTVNLLNDAVTPGTKTSKAVHALWYPMGLFLDWLNKNGKDEQKTSAQGTNWFSKMAKAIEENTEAVKQNTLTAEEKQRMSEQSGGLMDFMHAIQANAKHEEDEQRKAAPRNIHGKDPVTYHDFSFATQ